MADPDYTTSAKVRAVMSSAMDAQTVTDGEIIAKEFLVKPKIDGRLRGRGAPWAAGSAPEIVQTIEALEIAAALFQDLHFRADKKAEFVTWAETKAEELLDAVADGRIGGDGITAGGSLLVSDLGADRGVLEEIVGEDVDWQLRPEERSLS